MHDDENNTDCIIYVNINTLCECHQNNTNCTIGTIMEKFKEWPETLRILMKRTGDTQESLAEKLDLSQGAIGHWLNSRRKPKYNALNKLVGYFKVTADELLYGLEDAASNNNKTMPSEHSHVIRVLVVPSWEHAGKGNALKMTEKEKTKMDFVYFEIEPGKDQKLLAIKIQGKEMDAMISPSPLEKSFMPGEAIIYDLQLTSPVNGEYVIAKLPNEKDAIFRQFVVENGIAYLKPKNPTYKIIEMTSAIKIIGTVIGYAGKFTKPHPT